MAKIFKQVADNQTVSIGRLKSLGVISPYQAAFLFPKKYNDIRAKNINTHFSQLENKLGEPVYIGCLLNDRPVVSYDTNDLKKPPITRFSVKDRENRIMYLAYFGPNKELLEYLKPHTPLCFKGTVSSWNDRIQLKNIHWIDEKWIGRIQPVYPGKAKTISPETVLDRMPALVNAHADEAIEFLMEKLALSSDSQARVLLQKMGGSGNLLSLLKDLHQPKTLEAAEIAQAILKRIAAMDIVRTLEAETACDNPLSVISIADRVLDQVIGDMPQHLLLTDDQCAAIKAIVNDLRANKPMKRLLTGDVGTGKSIPIAVAAAVVARCNENVIILLPNEPLAEQMRRDIAEWWPDTEPKLVANSTKGLPDSRILVGTTALNFRIDLHYPVKLLIIDEQQKMSVDQRLKLARAYTNVLEASATPLPRSLALMKFGGLPLSTLREAYVEKTITTDMIENQADQKRVVFDTIKQSVSDGYQALIIYPLAETAEITDEPSSISKEQDLKSAQGAFSAWEKHFPGRVRFVHGKMKSEEKLANIQALRDGTAQILCSTTVVEVGLNLPKLRHVLIVHPERLGLSTLHQIRGRLCRNGGVGRCTLYTPDPISDKAMARLQLFKQEIDGFKIAIEDMKLRGMGDIAASADNEQSGFIDMSFLPGQKLSVDTFDWAVNFLNEQPVLDAPAPVESVVDSPSPAAPVKTTTAAFNVDDPFAFDWAA